MNFKALCAICLLLSSCNTRQNTKLDSVSSSAIDIFFGKIEAKEYKNAVDDLLSSNEYITQKDSSTIAMKSRFATLNEISGPYRGRSLLKKKRINDDLIIYSYLAKYDKKFYRFVFEFYNNGVETKIYKFQFDDTLEIELEESVKLYM
jgi:hypothetical protein